MEKVTTLKLQGFKKEKRRIAALTAYDAPFARIMDGAGMDVILVGDSLGMTMLGRRDTLSVTLDEMIHHSKAVVSAVERALVVVDMPFMSYHVSVEKALENAGRVLQETGAQAVKLEGGEKMAKTISALVNAGIPVMGHVGLLPQSVHQLGGFRVQGKHPDAARQIMADAKAVEKAGAFSVVMEAVPMELAEAITSTLKIPTIGVGAGAHCDGQILVMHDILGLTESPPRFAKAYANLKEIAQGAFSAYISEVKEGVFPLAEHSYTSKRDVKLKVVGGEEGEKKKR